MSLYNAVIWLLFHLTGIVLPIILSIFALLALKLSITLDAFTNSGQFALYSAGMWSTIYYIIVKPTSLRLRLTEIFALCCLVGLVLSAGLFTYGTLVTRGANIETAFLAPLSVGLFIVSTVIAFIAVIMDNDRTEASYRNKTNEQYNALSEAFDRTDGRE